MSTRGSTTTTATVTFTSPSLFTTPSSSSPFGNKPTFGVNNAFGSTSLGFSSFSTTQSTSQTGPFSSSSSLFAAPGSQSSGSFKTTSPSKNLMGASLNSFIQMPRPSSQWTEQKPFSFSSSSSNLMSNAPRQPNQVGFGFPNVSSPANTSTFPFTSTPSNTNQSTGSTPSFSLTNRFNKPGSFEPNSNFNQQMQPSVSKSNYVFGSFVKSEGTNEQQEQKNLTTSNLWNQSTNPPNIEQSNETKSSTENSVKQETSGESVQEKSTEGELESESKRQSFSRTIRRPSVTSMRKSPGLFAKALGGLKTHSSKPISTQIAKASVEKSKEFRSRKSSVRSGDGISVSPKEIATFTSIVCKGIPDELNNKQTLLQHFGRFGIVNRIVPSLSKQSATVTFQTHESALSAKNTGKIIRSDREPLTIFWLKSPVSHSRSDRSSTKTDNAKRSLKLSESRSPRHYDEEVKEELQSMSSNVNALIPPKLLDRPKDQNRSPKKTPGSHSETPSLRSFQEAPCKNVHDKYVVLDNVDKLLRLGIKKQQSTLATAKAIIGTCQDMCPEKERYMREDRKQLHPYEMNDDGICDHRKAIKEYSRSSADQEEPLPHELRPPRVLAMTMHYLVCNVMDIFENSYDTSGSAGEWYDFVWNRTRSIRKDITQQHLCDHITVEVIEMCTRFHIHCSARLCEEHMMTFDQRYNNENLTDCLQTLKHMYITLRAKGQPCKNEAEFVGYDMLLHLNEGDVIRHNTAKHPDVQNSQEIQLSLECANAISVNNYVRFFKLVRLSSYLAACILQRYFTQIRNKGFQSFIKAYCPSTTYVAQFPVSKFMTLFGFDDSNEVAEYVSFHNLQVEGETVMLDRSRFTPPEKIPLRRAKLLIESKRNCSVGELVYGEPIPENPFNYYEPQNSFEESGYLKREALTHFDAFDQVKPRKVGDDVYAPLDSSHKVMEDILNDIIAETVYSLTEKVANYQYKWYLDLVRSISDTSSFYLNDVCSSMIRDIAHDTFKELRAEELHNRLEKEAKELAIRRLIQRVKEECAMDLHTNLLEVVVGQETLNVVQRELREELEIYKNHCIEIGTQQLVDGFCQQWTLELIMGLVKDCHTEATNYRRITLTRVSRKLAFWKAAEFYQKWKTLIACRKRLRSSMEWFPSSVLCSTFISRRNSISDTDLSVKLTSPLQFESDRNRINRLLDMKALSDDLEQTIRMSFIDLIDIARNCLVNVQERCANGNYCNSQKHVTWKLIVTCATLQQHGRLSQWFEKKLMQPNSINQSHLLQGEIMSFVKFDNKRIPSTAISVKLIQPHKGNQRTLRGTQGITLVIEVPSNCDFYGFEAICKRESGSFNLLLSQLGQVPPVLIVVVGKGNLSLSELHYQLDRYLRQDMSLRAGYSVIQLSEQLIEPDCTRKLTEGLKWLRSKSLPPPSLHIDDVSHYVNKAVIDFYMPLINQFKAEYIPNLEVLDALISAFNHLIKHLADCASDSMLHSILWPPNEFAGRFPDFPSDNWNDHQTLRSLEQIFLSYCLPSFNYTLTSCEDWSSICTFLWDYIQHFQFTEWSHRTFLYGKLHRLMENFKERYCEIRNKFDVKPWQVLPWSKIIKIFVDYHLTISLNSVEVVYDPAMYSSFIETKAWNLIALHKSDAIPLTLMKSNEVVQNSISLKRRAADVFSKSDSFSDLKRSCLELRRQLEIEREKSSEYNKFLQEALNEL
ncbi:Germinal-center associated nuclear protein [Chamberlinius hualienensis]